MKVENDHHSKFSNLSNWKEETEKIRASMGFEVSARVKKGEFLKFLIPGRLDKVFQELSFKKNSTKKYYFSAKLLDVEVYCMLIVLFTR